MTYIGIYLIVIVLGQLLALFLVPLIPYESPWKWSWIYFWVNLAALLAMYLWYRYDRKR